MKKFNFFLFSQKTKRKDDAVVTSAMGAEFARNHGMVFLECSAKTKKNIEEVFHELVLKVIVVSYVCLFFLICFVVFQFLERPNLWSEGSSASTSGGGSGGANSTTSGGGLQIGESPATSGEGGMCAC